jgi:hypothetical protein
MWRQLVCCSLGLALTLSGCQKAQGGTGRLEARWTGGDSGKIAGPARALWCPEDSLVKLTVIQGDAGFGLALYPLDTLISSLFEISHPHDSTSRPRAAIAVRWFTDQVIAGYLGDSGTVTVTRRDSTFDGQLDAYLRSASGNKTIRLTGAFRGVRLRDRPGGCQAQPD